MRWLKKNWLWIVLLILFFFMRWEKQHFTVEKWERDPDARNEIVYDLMDRYELVGMTEKEVAAALRIPLSSVKNRLYRARKALQKQLQEEVVP